jgi:putative Holliday junction resolvase
MRFLGVDYGSKTIGIAVSDDAGGFAFPRDTIANDAKVFSVLAKMIADEKIEGIVVGDTRSLDGGANQITAQADAFAEKLKTPNMPLYRVREAWSTQEAARFAPAGQKHNDSAAAAIILQRFLDSQPKSE